MTEPKTEQKITVMTYEEVSVFGFEAPATFFIVNALGQYIFIHTRDRAKAQKYVDSEYGKGKYTVKTAKMSMKSGKGEVTASGYNSRRGMMPHLRKTL